MKFAFTALMPIKSESERLPGKNFRAFGGRPLFHWMLERLGQCDFIDEILVNTDAPQVVEDGKSKFPKVKMIARPPHLMGHHITMNSLIAYDIPFATNAHILQTHCTNPLLQIQTIERAVAQYLEGLEKYDSLLTVERLQKRVYNADASPMNHDNAVLLPTQDLPPLFVENSNLFIFSKASFAAAHHSRVGNHPQLFEMDAMEGIDIDFEADFLLAEAMLKFPRFAGENVGGSK